MATDARPVILIRRSLGGPGGAERVFRKYQAALEGEYEVIPVTEPEGMEGSSAAKALQFAKMADDVIAQHPQALSISLERGPSAQIYRAGDGVHKHFRRLLGGISLNPIHWVFPRLDEKSFRAAKAIIANSKMVAEEIRHYYPWTSKKVHVVYNGIDLKKFRPSDEAKENIRARLDLPKNRTLFLFMGNGWRRKGLAEALKICLRCKTLNPTLVIVGKGRASQLRGLPVIYRGVVDNMHEYYQACDAFVLPTMYDPFTSSVLEALACGLPVVTTLQNGASEVVQHGRTGYLLPRQNKKLKEAAHWLEKNIYADKNMISKTVEAYTAEHEIAAIRKIFNEIQK